MDILQEIDGMPSGKLKEELNFVYFIKTKDAIDPRKSYLWIKKWQKGEEEADINKKSGRVVGDGSVKDLVRALRS